MSYLVLARKWRPQNFDEVVGQPHVAKTLQNAVRSKRIAHSYLFTGARGVGKTSVARILAKTLNCESDGVAAPCNECSNCREVTQGNSPDVLEIDGASNRGIDSIRELRETVLYRPAKSPYKIYIIDEVHMLTTEAFNALLKTLEEPPEHVLFIFATTEPHKIPATILSRCQRFDFRRISTQEIVAHLRAIAATEQAQLSEGVLFAVAREADGSMRDAQSLLEQILAFSAEGLPDEEVLDILGVVDRRSVHRMAQAILERDVTTCLEVVGDLYRRGIDSRRFCQQLCDHFRNLLFWALAGGEGKFRPELPEQEQQLLITEAQKTTPENLYLYFQMILKGEEEIRRSTLPRVALEMLMLRLSQLPLLESLEGLLQKIAALERQLSQSPGRRATSDPPRAGPERPVTERVAQREQGPSEMLFEEPQPPIETAPPRAQPRVAPIAAGEAVERWETFLQWLQGKDPVLAAKLVHSRAGVVSESRLEVEVAEIFEKALSEPQSLAKLNGAADLFWGRTFEWVVRARPSLQPPAPAEASKAKSTKTNPRRLVLENPVVQQALEILGGELVDIRRLKPAPSNPGKKEVRNGESEPDSGSPRDY